VEIHSPRLLSRAALWYGTFSERTSVLTDSLLLQVSTEGSHTTYASSPPARPPSKVLSLDLLPLAISSPSLQSFDRYVVGIRVNVRCINLLHRLDQSMKRKSRVEWAMTDSVHGNRDLHRRYGPVSRELRPNLLNVLL
jgi:hypothetical protein